VHLRELWLRWCWAVMSELSKLCVLWMTRLSVQDRSFAQLPNAEFD
jgi:hypothetical protein